MATLIDSYSESNTATNVNISGGVLFQGTGQSFTTTGTQYNLYSAKFYMSKNGSPTGNATAKLYSLTGTYGTDSAPTGAALATSGNFDVSTLTGSNQLVELLFTGVNSILLSASTQYGVSIEYSGGDASNYVMVGTDNTSPTHGGNGFIKAGASWLGLSGNDDPFYIYGDLPSSANRMMMGIGN